MNRQQIKDLERIRKKIALRSKRRFDEEGSWVTTEAGNHIHINGEGSPDKGNPYVLAKAKGNRFPHVEADLKGADNKVLTTVEDAVHGVLSEFGIDDSIITGIEGFVPKGKAKDGLMASNGFNTVRLNKSLMKDYDSYDRACNDENYAVAGGIKGTAAHEAGHIIVNELLKMAYGSDTPEQRLKRSTERNKGSMEKSILKAAIKSYGSNPRISQYGSTSPKEKVAEAIADVYCNGDKCNPFSKAIVNEIKSRMKKHRNDADDDGRWVTTEEDHHIHINREGDIDKGNPYVLKAIKGFKTKAVRSVPVGARVRNGDSYYVKLRNGDFMDQATGEIVDDDVLSKCKPDTETTVKDQRGNDIDLSHCPLAYGKKMELDESTRRAVDSFEKKRIKNKIEYGCLLDSQGRPIGKPEYHGGHGSVTYPISAVKMATTMTHTHPRDSATIGGTFSLADLQDVFYDVTNLRAVASEGVYTFKCGKNMDRRGFYEWFEYEQDKNKKVYNDRVKSMNAKVRQDGNDYKAGKISYDEYLKRYDEYKEKLNPIANEYLVSNHNLLLSGQEEFGYEYSLERWE